MEKIIAKLSTSGNLLHYELHCEGHISKLSKQDLMDFVDTEIPFFYEDKKININDYLGESSCFSARVSTHSYNPF
ncbi:MAG: hypothetical protein RBT05_06405 [Bacteroidales bacterium]|jgi:hypothetical protein|nr:hypothetical protein [Bacteroidales bacterium]